MAKITCLVVPVADKAVTTAGTRVALTATETLVRQVVVQWHPSNTGNVYIGDVTVAAGVGLILNASNPSVSFAADDTMADEDAVYFDLAKIYIDSANNGDKVKILYMSLEAISYNS